MGLKISDLTPVAANSLDGTEPVELGIPGDKNAPNGAFIPPGYIDGLTLQWDAVDGITVISGAAYIESLGRVVRSGADIAKAGLTLTASTWYHVYLYLNAGTPDIEIVTSAPDVPYNGTARSKTGDASRRYVGSVLTDYAGNIYKFKQDGRAISYLVNLVEGALPMRVLKNGQASTTTLVSLAAVVPMTSQRALLRMSNTDANNQYNISSSDYPLTNTGNDGQFGIAPTAKLFSTVSLDAVQTIKYVFPTAPSGGGAYVDVIGYEYGR